MGSVLVLAYMIITFQSEPGNNVRANQVENKIGRTSKAN